MFYMFICVYFVWYTVDHGCLGKDYSKAEITLVTGRRAMS